MAWTPPSAPKHIDLGEIPGIRELSDEEKETLRTNNPDGGNLVIRNLEKREEEISDALVNEYGQTAMDIGNFIDEWRDCPEEEGVEFSIFSATLQADIEERLKETGDIFDADDVFDVACRRTLLPMMFYFGVNMDSVTGKVFATVTRGDWWNDGKIMDTDSLSRFIVPEFLTNPNCSRYDVDEGMTPSKLRRELKNQGFIENHEVSGL